MFRGVSAVLWFSWHGSCRRGMEGDTLSEPGQWEGVAATLPVVQKVLSGPARRDFWHFLMCDRKGASGKRGLLRPCCGQGHCGGDRGSVLTSMPGFPGGPSGPGAPGSPLAPFKREKAWGQIEKSSSRRDKTFGELRGGMGTHRGPGGSGRAFVTLGKGKKV